MIKQVKALVGARNVTVQYEKSQRLLKAEAELEDPTFYQKFLGNLAAFKPQTPPRIQQLVQDTLQKLSSVPT